MTDATDLCNPRVTENNDTDAPHMSPVTPAEDMRSIMINNVSWSAIFAGAVIALVVQVIVNLAGIGIGAATLDPGTGDSPGAGALGIGAGIWFAVSTILAALIGGIAAGRLSGRPKASTAAWHGLTAWAVSTLFVVYLLGSGIGGLLGGAVSTLGGVAGGVTKAAGSAVQAVAPANPFDAIEQQIRGAVPANADPAAARDAAIAAVRTAVTGTEAEADQARAQAAQALAQAQGIPVPEAEAQVQRYQDQFQQTVESAKQAATEAADTAAAAATTGALLAALVLLLGAAAGWFGGRMGAVEPTVTTGRRIV